MSGNDHRYLLFTGAGFYPGGGWGDFAGAFETWEDAVLSIDMRDLDAQPDWIHIVDIKTLTIVLKWDEYGLHQHPYISRNNGEYFMVYKWRNDIKNNCNGQ